MNNDMKWEAVELIDLRNGDRVRIAHTNGDTFHAVVEGDTVVLFGYARVDLDDLADSGYTFERAVPERTLPTTAGFYAVSKRPHVHERLLRLTGSGEWGQMFPRGHKPDELHTDRWIAEVAHREGRLTRLVAVTEVEEAEKRARTKALHEADALVKSKFAEHGRSMIGPHIIRNNFVEFHLDATEWDGSNV